MSYVYILENHSGIYYIGYTKNLDRRVSEHSEKTYEWESKRMGENASTLQKIRRLSS